MKKAVYSILICILCCMPLLACDNYRSDTLDDYKSTSGRCIVSIPSDYDVYYENSDADDKGRPAFDRTLYNADTVNGAPKKQGRHYYSVLNNEPFRILTPLGIIQNKNSDGQTLVYWQLNDTLYKDGDRYLSQTLFSCATDTEITPVYKEFRPVGMLLFATDKDGTPTVPVDDIFDSRGDIKEQCGVWYLYGVYDFEPNREFWNTNMTLETFDVSATVKPVAQNYSKNIYTLTVEIFSDEFAANHQTVVSPLYKIDGHGYMLYGSSQVIGKDMLTVGTHLFPIGEHTVEYIFVD